MQMLKGNKKNHLGPLAAIREFKKIKQVCCQIKNSRLVANRQNNERQWKKHPPNTLWLSTVV